MGHKQHPLDVFRTSETGFDKATRRRRRVQGKVLASKARPAPTVTDRPRGAGLLGGIRGGDAVLVRRVAYGAFAVILVAGLVWALQFFTSPGGGGLDLPELSYEQALGGEAGGAAGGAAAIDPSQVEAWTIRAAHYNGTTNGQLMATAAKAELQRRGWRDVLVLGYPDETDAHSMLYYELVVGLARGQQALDQDLAALRAISDWPGGNPAPFLEARVVPHPMPAD